MLAEANAWATVLSYSDTHGVRLYAPADKDMILRAAEQERHRGSASVNLNQVPVPASLSLSSPPLAVQLYRGERMLHFSWDAV